MWGDRGNVLATPALSVNSPWLNKSGPNQLNWGISDEAYEKIPSQILQRLRSDSIGINHDHHSKGVKFTGMAGYAYIVERSSDLLHWDPVSTNYCRDGTIQFSDKSPGTSYNYFYRTQLLPPDESAPASMRPKVRNLLSK